MHLLTKENLQITISIFFYVHSFLDGATTVNVNLYVRSFEKIDDVKMVSKNKLVCRKCMSRHTLRFGLYNITLSQETLLNIL